MTVFSLGFQSGIHFDKPSNITNKAQTMVTTQKF